MPTADGRDTAVDIDPVRREYEESLSWRLTSPVRAAGRFARSIRPSGATGEPPGTPFTAGRYDSWLEDLHGERLAAIDRLSAEGGPERYALFRDLDVDLWTMLLTREYNVFPNIRALLPSLPDPSLQELWNGQSGLRLALQSMAFYSKVSERFARHGQKPLADARVLDFGCGWGRLTRFFARDVEPGRLFGCDPVEQILDECRTSGVPATLARSEFVPERLPFQSLDLAFSFSVFTHISESAAESCLGALHRALEPGGILVLTVRPPEYLQLSPLMHPTLRSLGRDYRERLKEPLYLFAPHAAEASHLQYEGGEMTYGESVITRPYIEQRWSDRFELLELDVLLGDLHQVAVTLRRR